MKLALPNRIFMFITPNGCGQNIESLERMCEEAVSGGVSVIQLRDLTSNMFDLQRAAYRLKNLLGSNCPLIINRHLEIALQVQAAGVHFSQSQMTNPVVIAQAKQSNLVVGISVHSVNTAEKAIELSPCYIQFGSVFPTKSHPNETPQGLLEMEQVYQIIPSSLKLVAVGGIHLNNMQELTRRGIQHIAVISAIVESSDKKEYCRAMKQKLDKVSSEL